jgi:glycosyltransferase involved in cell wall biosynthesis
MKIVYLSLVDISEPTGPGTNELEFVNSMQIQGKVWGDDTFFITPKLKNDLPIELNNHKTIDLRPWKLGGLSVFISQQQYKTSVKQIFKRWFGDHKPDVVVLRLDDPKLLGVVRYFESNGINYSLKHFHHDLQSTVEGWRNAILHRQYIRAVVNSLFIDTTWESMVPSLNAVGCKNYEVIDNGANIDTFYPREKLIARKDLGLDKFDQVVGYIGGFPMERGAREMIESSKFLLGKYPRMGFLIVGDSKRKKDSQLAEMKQMVKDHGVDDHFVITGYLPFEQMPVYFNTLDIGVALVPPEVVLKYGNSSQKIYQYLACGVPVIIPEGCHKQLVKDNLVLEYGVHSENFATLVSKLIDRTIPNFVWSEKMRFEYVKDQFSTYKQYNRRRDKWRQLINK